MKTKQIITVCLLAAFLAGFGLWSVLRTPDAVSQAERRPLAQRPAFTAAGFLSGKFSDALDDFAADQFPLREQLRTLRSLVSYDVMGQRDVNGVYLSQGYAAKLDFPLNTTSVKRAATLPLPALPRPSVRSTRRWWSWSRPSTPRLCRS